MKEKLTSRKFWLAVSGIITGLLLIFFGLPDETLSVISGFILVLGDTIAYIVTEGKIDERKVNNEETNEER